MAPSMSCGLSGVGHDLAVHAGTSTCGFLRKVSDSGRALVFISNELVFLSASAAQNSG